MIVRTAGRSIMEVILARCIALDTAAQEAYVALARVCPDPELSKTFQRMSTEEWTHVEWWTELLNAYIDGRVPAPANVDELETCIDEAMASMGRLLEKDFAALSTDEMLELAVHMEFFMLDPAFGELLDLSDPTGLLHRHEAYSRHVTRLVSEIENRLADRGLASFLARVLVRTFRDQERLAALATRDSLTGLYNRRGLYSHLAQWCAWAERYGRPLGVLLIDVDHFKSVNDEFGHPVGDIALTAVAHAIGSAVRESDFVGRYGGDEFAVLAPETSRDALEALAARVVEGVRSIDLSARLGDRGVTASVGCTYVSAGGRATAEIMLACADRSLYTAKAAGRDQAGAAIEASLECEHPSAAS
jgi:diguanylate cyclase (GGDEF)-like protein